MSHIFVFIFLFSSIYVTCEQTGVDYTGRLTVNCIKSYEQIYITRLVPPREYLYYHETLDPEIYSRYSINEYPVKFSWRIVGGNVVSIQEVPYQVLYGKFCGGTLIAPNWVITAAHCKEKENYVYAGSTLRDKAIPYRICAHFIHPLWNTTQSHSHDFDYQLILLETSVPINSFARPIAIGKVEDIQTGELVGISGWGHLQYKRSKMQNELHRVYVPVMSRELCLAMPDGDYNKITPRMFCAGYVNGTKDSCQGDSGGPVVYNSKLVGLVSFGVGCAGARHPGVYTNIPMARDWIRAITALPL